MADHLSDRIAGGNPLERRCRRLLGLSLLLIISIGFMWYGQQAERLIDTHERVKARTLVDTILTQEHWHKTAMSPAFEPVIRELGTSLNGGRYHWKFLKADAIETGSQSLDAFERQTLSTFRRSLPPGNKSFDSVEDFVERILPDQQQYEYFQPIYAKSELCVGCHRAMVGQPKLALNDLIAVVEVKLSNKTSQVEKSKNHAVLITTSLITSFLAIATAFAILRLTIFKPLERQQGSASEPH